MKLVYSKFDVMDGYGPPAGWVVVWDSYEMNQKGYVPRWIPWPARWVFRMWDDYRWTSWALGRGRW